MSQRIYAAISHDFQRRMQNWGRWAARSGDSQVSPSSMWSSAPSGGYRETVTPILDGEAGDTDRALYLVPIRYAQAVRLFWQYEGKSLIQLSRLCGKGVDYRTFEDRVIKGHVLLNCEILKRSDAVREQREQFEKLHAA